MAHIFPSLQQYGLKYRTKTYLQSRSLTVTLDGYNKSNDKSLNNFSSIIIKTLKLLHPRNATSFFFFLNSRKYHSEPVISAPSKKPKTKNHP